MIRFLAVAFVLFPSLAVAQDVSQPDTVTPQEQPVTLQTDPVDASALSAARDEVRATIVSLFDAMRAADTSGVRDVFHERATLQSVVPSGDGYRLSPGSIEAFITALGQPHDAAWDERVGPISVEVDAGLAQAWMDYQFFLGDTFSHCGVNAIHLVSTEAGWQILNIVDTRRPDCEEREG